MSPFCKGFHTPSPIRCSTPLIDSQSPSLLVSSSGSLRLQAAVLYFFVGCMNRLFRVQGLLFIACIQKQSQVPCVLQM